MFPQSGKQPANLTLGPVALVVPELDRSLAFYQGSLGFRLMRSEGTTVHLCAGGCNDPYQPGPELLILKENEEGHAYPDRTGLYHFAILVPSRKELAFSLKRLVETGVQPQGFADHGISEAIYLEDPDGNGIEIYNDRPQFEWPRNNGNINMVTDPLDVANLLSEIKNESTPWPGLDPETRLGHIHLKVADIASSEDFYINVLGFELVQHMGRRASFVSVGGYHHHIGLNTWESAGALPSPPGSLGLDYFGLRLPDRDSLQQLRARIEQASLSFSERPGGFLVHDPSQNAILCYF